MPGSRWTNAFHNRLLEPAIVNVPLRARPLLTATEKFTAPLPFSVPPEVTEIHEVLLAAVQVPGRGGDRNWRSKSPAPHGGRLRQTREQHDAPAIGVAVPLIPWSRSGPEALA